MSASYVSRPSYDETTPRAPTIASSSRRNAALSSTSGSRGTFSDCRARRNGALAPSLSGADLRSCGPLDSTLAHDHAPSSAGSAGAICCSGRLGGGDSPLRCSCAGFARAFEGEAARVRAARTAPPVGRGAEPPSESLDRPGLARDEQLRDVARTALGNRRLLLLDQDLLVRRLFLLREDADRDRVVGRPQVGEDEGGRRIGLVVDPDLRRIGVLHPHDFRADTFE